MQNKQTSLGYKVLHYGRSSVCSPAGIDTNLNTSHTTEVCGGGAHVFLVRMFAFAVVEENQWVCVAPPSL